MAFICNFVWGDADTTPPKKLIKDMSQDFYTAGFCPGAIIYFSHVTPQGEFMQSVESFLNVAL